MTRSRVLVVDDSALLRVAIRDVLEATNRYEIVGEAASGLEALGMVKETKPDIISLDVEMPGIDGLGVLRRVMRTQPTRTVLVSSHTDAGADTTLEGLSRGAIDFVLKAQIGEDFAAFADRLRSAFRAAEEAKVPVTGGTPTAAIPATTTTLRRPGIIAVASSTGGPDALERFLGAFETAPRVPMLIVQHMPPAFTKRLAQRLDTVGPVDVSEAEDGSPLRHGAALVAPGGSHLIVQDGSVNLDDRSPIGGLRPRADVTLETVATQYGMRALGVILTGMGDDGLAGSRRIVDGGGQVIVQDSSSVVVDGMPGRVREAELSTYNAPPAQLARLIEASCLRQPTGKRAR